MRIYIYIYIKHDHECENLYAENFKIFIKKIEDETKKRKDIL